MRIPLGVFTLIALSACSNLPAVRPVAEGPNPPANAPVATAPTPALGKEISVEVEGSSRDETKRPFLLSLSGNAQPTLREDEALRMVNGALLAEGFTNGLAGNGAKPLRIKARFTKESSGFGFLGGTKHAVHLEAFDGDRLVWEYHATGAGEQDDIRPILPTLLAAGRGLIGSSTAGKRTVSLREGEALKASGAPEALKPAPKRSARRGLFQN